MAVPKALIHHDGALGDFLLSLPCLRVIKGESAFTHFAGRPDVVGLLREIGFVDEVSSADSCLYASLYTKRTDEKTADFLAQFERAFVFTVRDNSVLATSIRTIIPRTETIITVPHSEARMHIADFRLKQLGVHCEKSDLPTKLDIPSAYKERARELLVKAGYEDDGRPLIALHPGSGSGKKNWPLENYFVLLERIIQNLDAFFIIFSGPAEDLAMREKMEKFARRHARVFPFFDEQLIIVAALLSLCRLYVGNDSGITHLAAAVNGNVVILYGSTDPLLWRPVGQNVRVISAGAAQSSLLTITVNEVYESLTASLSFGRQDGEEHRLSIGDLPSRC
jgi:ADP-heptose:LPS heptosyltransferase